MNADSVRLPPHDHAAETCLLASLLLDPDARVEHVPALAPSDFFSPDHAAIFSVVADLTRRHRPVDAVLLRAELDSRQLLDEVGGQAYIGEILNAVPSAAHAAHYAGIVREKSMLRAVLSVANHAIRQVYVPAEGSGHAANVLRELARSADEMATAGVADTIVPLDRAVLETLSAKYDGVRPRRATGLRDLDRLVGGLPIGGMTIVAAPPGMGKSQLCKVLVRNLAAGVGGRDNSVACGIVAAEENVGKIVDNYLAAVSGVQNSRIVYNRDLTAADWSKLYAAGDERTCCWPMRCSTRPASLNGRSRGWWWRPIRRTAGSIGRACRATRPWCSSPTTARPACRTACHTSPSTISPVRPTRRRAAASRCAASPSGIDGGTARDRAYCHLPLGAQCKFEQAHARGG